MTQQARTPIRVDDLTWLNMDRPNNLMVVSGLMWFRVQPDSAAVDDAIRTRIVDRFPVFSRRPIEAHGSWYWEDDADFALERHVHHISLGARSDLATLQEHISARHTEPLPKDQALWRIELISGVHGVDASGPVTVLFARFHHSLADGIRLVQLLLSLLDSADDATRPSKVGRGRAGRSLQAVLGRVVNNSMSAGKLLFGRPAAGTVWTGTPGQAKTLTWIDGIDLTRVKAAAAVGNATVNDVLLSAVAGGLRRYLIEQGDTRTNALPWLIPVALKPLEDNLPTELGNHFTLVNLSLPIDLDDPTARLREIHVRMGRLKNSDEALMVFGLQKIVARTPRAISVNLTNMVANRNTGVLTNVPGPTGPMSLAGTEVSAIVGWNPTSGNQPVSVCLFSYNGQVTIGLCTDNGLIPDPAKVAHHLTEELSCAGLLS